MLRRIVRTSRHYRARSPLTGLDRRGDPLHCRSRAGPQPLKCANGASSAWGTPTIDRLLLLRGGSCVNGEKRLNSALPWPLATPKHKGPSANPGALCSFQYATQDTLGSARSLCIGHGKGPVNAFAQGILNVSHLFPSRLRRANCVENAPIFPNNSQRFPCTNAREEPPPMPAAPGS